MYTSALHTGLANNISNTNCPAPTAMFSQLSSAELDYKPTGKLLWAFFLFLFLNSFYSIPINLSLNFNVTNMMSQWAQADEKHRPFDCHSPLWFRIISFPWTLAHGRWGPGWPYTRVWEKSVLVNLSNKWVLDTATLLSDLTTAVILVSDHFSYNSGRSFVSPSNRMTDMAHDASLFEVPFNPKHSVQWSTLFLLPASI